ncbi:MAG: PQQ-binding-like beta-propeller repeat protein [Chthoniobacteraceae bacterium]
MKTFLASFIALAATTSLCTAQAPRKPLKSEPAKSGASSGWFNWRGPSQNGSSPETGLPDKADAKKPLWTADFPGQSTPVIAGGKLYINGFLGEGANLREGVSCFDADTGKLLWQHFENDFLSDIIYLRYATGSPTVDPETGNVYVQGGQGIFSCFSADGKLLWQHSLMEEYGRLTFPNGRTATPVVDRDLVITRGITNGWGANGPAADRLLAFDKKTGDLVWLTSPADRPQDPTFSPLQLSWWDGKRVFFTACGDSSVACVNVRTGDPLFRFPAAKAGAKGGINGGVLRYKDSLIVAHESENVDTSEVGRTAMYRIPAPDENPKDVMHSTYPVPPGMKIFSPTQFEKWRNPLGNLGSSPALAGDTLYEVTGVGEFAAVNAETGAVKWKKKLGPEQRQSSPFAADGKVYVAFYIAAGEGKASQQGDSEVGDGELYIFKPGEKDAEVLSRTKLTGRCFGSPIAYNGKLYIQTDKKLYAFGKAGENPGAKSVVWENVWPTDHRDTKPEVAKLQLIPNEVLLEAGKSAQIRVRALDKDGFTVSENVDPSGVKFDNYIPPTALVKAKMNGTIDAAGKLTADPTRIASAGAFQGELKANEKVSGLMRGRVLQDLPIKIDFENYELNEMTGPGIGQEVKALPPAEPGRPAPPGPRPGPTNWNAVEPPTPFAYPPLAWNSARFRLDIRKAPGDGNNKALCKTIDHKLFQRAQVFFGKSDLHDYTIEADVMSEGNKRKGCDIGLICQRYIVALKFNEQTIEVNSNQERVKLHEPITLERNVWYRMKVTVVPKPNDGGVTVKGKAWKKGEAEPEKWNIQFDHTTGHKNGSPGIFCLSSQEQRAWFDNIEVKAN